MQRYPTPPSTSSPKQHDHGYHDGHNLDGRNHNEAYSSFTNASTIVPASTEAWASGYPATSISKPGDFYGITSQDPSYNIPGQFSGPQNTDSFKIDLQDPSTKSYGYSDKSEIAHRPAQETYWQTTSAPVSPSHNPSTTQNPHPYSEQFDPSYSSHPGPPPRRSSSPIPNTLPSTTDPNPYYNPPQQTPHPQPIRRRSSPIPGRISSPFKKPLSPYSLSRPKPRPGFIKRVAHRIRSWIRSLFCWIRANPIKTGFISFIPLMLGAGVVKTVKGVKHLLGQRANKKKEKEHKLGKEAKKLEKKWHDEIFGEFGGFAGSNGGPLDGFLKIIHMLV